MNEFECTECKDNSILDRGTCKCMLGFYNNQNLSGLCVSCAPGCKMCDGITCFECIAPKILHDNNCIDDCPIRYF